MSRLRQQKKHDLKTMHQAKQKNVKKNKNYDAFFRQVNVIEFYKCLHLLVPIMLIRKRYFINVMAYHYMIFNLNLQGLMINIDH